VAELPKPTQRFLIVAAAEPTGDPIVVWRAASNLGIDPDDAAPAIDAGLVEVGTQLWFRHPLVRSAVYTSAPIVDRQAAHRGLADATDAALDPDRRAWHRALGSPGPDEEIAAALESSADRARARGGFAATAALLERAVTLTSDPAQRGPRILAAASAHLEAGSYGVAESLLAAVEAVALNEIERAQADMLRARHALFGGDIRAAPDLTLRAAQRLEPLDATLAGAAHLGAMAAAEFVGVFALGAGWRETSEAALRCPMPSEPTTKEWLRIGFAHEKSSGPAAAAPALRQALFAPVDAAPAEAMQWLGYQSGAALVVWDIEAHRRISDEMVASARAQGVLTLLPIALNALAHAQVLEGDLDAAGASLTEAAQIEDTTGSSLLFTSVRAIRAGLQGGEGASQVIADQMAAARTARAGYALTSALWASAVLGNGSGQYERALAVATEAFEHRWRGSPSFFHELIEAAVRSGKPDAAVIALERLSESTEASGSDWALGIQRRSAALLADRATAEDWYREAIDRLGRTTVRPELARAHLLYGEWLRRENRRIDAREQLRTAHGMLTEMGIQAFAERARRELLATGETVRKRTADSLDALTPQESHIARLAAERRTNPEIGAQLFISPRTVEYHLTKVFTKLGVSSRRDLAGALTSATTTPRSERQNSPLS
jgi:DNA-binding CsgD family transcriptional regulator/tetratricopeptide (TPR) repeat protein